MSLHFAKKPILSISALGTQRFVQGLLCGLSLSVAFFLFFEHLREVLRYPVNSFQPSTYLSASDAFYFSLFTAAMSFSFGFCFTLFIWVRPHTYRTNRRHVFKKAAQGFALAGIWVYAFIFLTFERYAAILYWAIMMDMRVFNLQRDYPIILLLLPLLVFLQGWMFVRLAYRVGWWWLGSAFAGCIFTITFATCFGKDPSLVNRVIDVRHAETATILEEELQRAKKLYNLNLPPKVQATLTQWNSQERKTLEEVVLNRFHENKNLSADSLLLIYVLQKTRQARLYCGSHFNWQYPKPFELYEGLLVHRDDPLRYKLYLDLLAHQRLLYRQENQASSNHAYHFCWTYYPPKLGNHLEEVIALMYVEYDAAEPAYIPRHHLNQPPPPPYLLSKDRLRAYREMWKQRTDSIRDSFN